MENPDRYLINSVLRAARVLEAFSFEKPAFKNSVLSKELGLSKSTLTRLLYTLQKAGFLTKESKTGEYRLTHRLYRIGCVYLNQLNLHTYARPLLADLSASTGETVHLAMFDGVNIIYIDKIESPHSIAMRSKIGMQVPAYCTAVGKVFLADLDAGKLEKYLDSVELVAHTSNTITDRMVFKEHIEGIRQQGYAVDNIENEADVKCVAAPVRDATHRVVSAISISAPAFRADRPEIEKKLASAVVRTARSLSKQLGCLKA